MTQFKTTYDLLNNYISAMTTEKPLSYETWAKLPKDYKAPALFVNFFDQVVLAWNKLRTDAAVEEECVEEAIQYLWKQVPIIERDRRRYTPNNIYTVVSNAIYCKSIDPWKGQTAKNSWYNNVQSNVIVFDGDDLDLFDELPSAPFATKVVESDGWQHTDMSDICLSEARRLAFEKAGIWKAIFGEVDHFETVVKKRKVERCKVAIDDEIKQDIKALNRILGKYGYTVVKRADNARYILSDSEKQTKMIIDADRYSKPVFTSEEFVKLYCKGETQEEYTVEVPVYRGGMDSETQDIVRYIMGEDVKLNAHAMGRIPEVTKVVRELILKNKDAFEFVGLDTTSLN